MKTKSLLNTNKLKYDSRIKQGFYSALYFRKTKKILNNQKHYPLTVMQFSFFDNKEIKLCGIEEIVWLLKKSLTKKQLSQIQVYGYAEGTIIKQNQPVLYLIGPYEIVCIFENLIDGILQQRTSVATNCYQLLQVINKDQLIYMADRSNSYLNQPYDGYAAYIGGVRRFVTDASIELIKDPKDCKVTGTMPHALIQQFNGDLIKALNAFHHSFPNDQLVALIDYHNNIEQEIIKLAQSNLKNKIFAVRIDTSKNLVDQSLKQQGINQNGVNHELICLARRTLNKHGMNKTKIIVSSAMNYERIKQFKDQKTPADFYGVGSALIQSNIHFTADLVYLNNKQEAKYGRSLFMSINKIKKLKRLL